jgi:DNA-binding NtrC family response regulator
MTQRSVPDLSAAISAGDIAGNIVKTLPAALNGPFTALLADPHRGSLNAAVEAVRAHYDADGCFLAEWQPSGEWHEVSSSGLRPHRRLKAATATLVEAAADATGHGLQVRSLDAYCLQMCGVLVRPLARPLVAIVSLDAARLPEDQSSPIEALLKIVDFLRSALLEPAPHWYADLWRMPSYHVVGRSPAMTALYSSIRTLAGCDGPVLIEGETGVGKEHIVRILHDWSWWRSALVIVDCTTISYDDLESILIDVAAAQPSRQWLSEAGPDTGRTHCFDEIADLPLPMQGRLLKAMEHDGISVTPSAGRRAGLMATTNADLAERVNTGAFRADLYYRLTRTVLRVPPLRKRPEDIRELVVHFVRAAARDSGKTIRGVSTEALQRLVTAPWPGNIRELEHVVRWLVLEAPDNGTITTDTLARVRMTPARIQSNRPSTDRLEDNLARLERNMVASALCRAGGNRGRAAALLGVSKEELLRRLQRLDARETNTQALPEKSVVSPIARERKHERAQEESTEQERHA